MTVITSTSPIGDLIFSLVLECALLLCLVHDPNHPKINTAIRTCKKKTMYHNFILVTLYLLEPFNDQTPLSCFGSNLPGWPCSN